MSVRSSDLFENFVGCREPSKLLDHDKKIKKKTGGRCFSHTMYGILSVDLPTFG